MAKTTRFLQLLLLILTLCVIHHDAAASRGRSAYQPPPYAAIIMDAQTGEVLHASQADSMRYPASLTKMMTLFLAFEALDRGRLFENKYLVISSKSVNQPPSRLGLRIGDKVTIKQAILALVTRSANDVAMAMAETIGGSEQNFAKMMTARARSLGMKNTTFLNPSGLPNTGQRTTARDMAILSRALMQYFPHYYRYFSTKSFVHRGQIITTHNNLMKRFGGMDGIKTGFINSSGFNLAASAVRNNRRVIVVVFGGRSATSRDNHVADLMNRGFAMLDRRKAVIQVAQASAPIIAPVVSKPIERTLSTPNKPLQAIDTLPTTMFNSAQAATATSAATQQQPVEHVAFEPRGGWGIQIGAFGSPTLGQQALRLARMKLPQLPANAEGIVMPAQTPNGLVYRARFLGLSADSATAACRALRECMVFAAQ